MKKAFFDSQGESKYFSMRMPLELYRKVHHYAADHDTYVTTALCMIVAEYFESQSQNQ